METFEARLKRFLVHSPDEIFLTILNSISNFTLPEIRVASSSNLHNLAILGAHAVAQTIGEQIYGRTGLAATRFYLESFVDEPADAVRFADIAVELHGFRNIHAHRWSARLSHYMVLDTSVVEGWTRDGQDIRFNPVEFIRRFERGFGTGRPIWTRPRQLDPLHRLRQKYRYLQRWLELPDGDPLEPQIRALADSADLASLRVQEEEVKTAIAGRFSVDMS